MPDHDDFAFEVAPGLPAKLPAGEELLWQGRPATMALAREAFAINWIAAYMGAIVVWRTGAGFADGGLPLAVAMGLPYLVLALAGYLIILLLAWAQARATVYTITSARVLMRIGAALSLTYNVPFTQITTARLDLKPSGTGTIAMETNGDVRLSYAVLWPHVRPWQVKVTQPALRCIPDAQKVAGLLAEAANTRMNQPIITRDDAPVGAVVAAE